MLFAVLQMKVVKNVFVKIL